MKVLEGNFSGKGLKIGIVAGRFNEFISSKLIAGAEDSLKRHEVNPEDITLASSMLLVVKTPNIIGIPLFKLIFAHPLETSEQT